MQHQAQLEEELECLCNTRSDAARLLPPYQRLVLGRALCLRQGPSAKYLDATISTSLADKIGNALYLLHEVASSTPGAICSGDATTSIVVAATAVTATTAPALAAAATIPATKRRRMSSNCATKRQNLQQEHSLLLPVSVPPAMLSAARRRFERELFPTYIIEKGWRHVVPYTARRYAPMQRSVELPSRAAKTL